MLLVWVCPSVQGIRSWVSEQICKCATNANWLYLHLLLAVEAAVARCNPTNCRCYCNFVVASTNGVLNCVSLFSLAMVGK